MGVNSGKAFNPGDSTWCLKFTDCHFVSPVLMYLVPMLKLKASPFCGTAHTEIKLLRNARTINTRLVAVLREW
ncbi:hypothetical protein B0G75_1011086 [Paraburkholderia sp. BL18I3N2]|uniref:hypothetical protein n=1 Tax=Paraburkholderia sp. BL18I3N2 TaxID=1938799 RepID=UPI000D082F20|nr:hypothetical protein [Paraburkholderia sp. BL18I3N2]PRX36897.1 hypothetical protein B0G75_1011086 [Paraburkholderia sp. BL18I3N2]